VLRSFVNDFLNEGEGATMATGTFQSKNKTEENQMKDAAGKAKEAAGHMVDKAVDKAKDAASSVSDMASHAASSVGKKADDLTADAGTNIKNLGNTIEEKGPHGGVMGQASHAVAETLRESGKYLEDAKLSGMAEDLTQMIRRNPMPALFIGIGVGFLLGRALRA
jgi:ElaB/YqjD/DUF883 family membrane-anchored ribosome-binding protein